MDAVRLDWASYPETEAHILPQVSSAPLYNNNGVVVRSSTCQSDVLLSRCDVSVIWKMKQHREERLKVQMFTYTAANLSEDDKETAELSWTEPDGAHYLADRPSPSLFWKGEFEWNDQ